MNSSLLREEQLVIYNESVSPIIIGNRVFEASTDIGLRPTQEDRLLLIPSFFSNVASICGVFDGTVGVDASDFLSKNFIHHLCNTEEMNNLEISEALNENSDDIVMDKIRTALKKAFLSADEALLQICEEKKLHYASSTGVVAFLYRNVLTIAHVGDSKACIARQVDNEIQFSWLTVDHKPNTPNELKRIEQNGGSLVWLHGNKPYIRGGDFVRRQAAGEHPKQLNYSRAFGGKDLKMFGLSASPEVSQLTLGPQDSLLLLGSDGLWDSLSPESACAIAVRARREGRSASRELSRWAVHEMPARGVRDNVTVIAVFLNESLLPL